MEAIRDMMYAENTSQMQEDQRAIGDANKRLINKRPDPEVTERPERRRFSAEYKLRILAEADACETTGEIGALLRREGLYSSHLSRWRKRQRQAALGSLSPVKRGPDPDPTVPFKKRVNELERENAKLKKELEAAKTIIDVQKKVSGLLGIQEEEQEEESS